MEGMPRNGKKGISLAYVIVAAMVLLILSGVLAAAAGRNLSLTAESVQSRQAYLTVKSAVEFAKGEAYREAEAGALSDFSVAPGGDPFRKADPAAPDGKNIYARCTVGEDGLVTVSGRVAYDSGRYRSLGCSFRLTEEPASGIGAVNCFVAAGQRYGPNQYLNISGENYELKGTKLNFPVVLKTRVSSPSQPFSAPEMYFLDSDESLFYKGGGIWQTSLTSDVFCFAGAVRSEATAQNGVVLLYRYGKLPRGIIWFLEATEVRTADDTTEIPAGAYYFQEGANLMRLHVGGASDRNALTVIPEEDPGYKAFYPKISYYAENTEAIVSSEESCGVGWTSDGCLQVNHAVGPEPDKDVFMYVDDFQNGNWRNNKSSPQTFEARSIVLQYHSGGGNSPFTFPAYNNVHDANQKVVTFRTDTLWLNAQKDDGPPDNSGDVLVIKQGASDSRLVLESLNEASPVLVYLPHGLVVKNAAGAELYSVSPGTYTVDSGTNLFTADADAFSPCSSGGGGSGGGSGEGGVTVSELKYTDS